MSFRDYGDDGPSIAGIMKCIEIIKERPIRGMNFRAFEWAAKLAKAQVQQFRDAAKDDKKARPPKRKK